MSRIKDLLAIEENIEDLIPETKVGVAHIVNIVKNWVVSDPKSEDYIADNAEFGLGDDDGQPCMFLENFLTLCEQLAEDKLDTLIEHEHLNISDEQYKTILDRATDEVANVFADYEDSLCNDAFADYNRDKKYLNEELKEKEGRI